MRKVFQLLCILLILTYSLATKGQPKVFKEILRIPASPVKNQEKTGTCWSFATVSFLESEILRKGKGEYDLSEMFFVRQAYLLKAEKYLLYHGQNSFSQGGQAHDVMNIIRKYGIMPEFAYPGNPLSPGVHDHGKMFQDLEKSIEKTNLSFNEKKADKWEEKFSQLLNYYFGEVSDEFGIKGQIYLPAGFTNYLGIDPDDYLEFTSYVHHPFYELIDLEIPDNWSHDRYTNIPIEELVEIIDSSLYKGYSVCWDGDTSEKGFSNRTGVATLEPNTTYDQASRQHTFMNRETTDDHLMHIIGIAEDEDGQKYYIAKNSWGIEKSDLDGYMYLSALYVNLKTVAILVNRNSVPQIIMDKITW